MSDATGVGAASAPVSLSRAGREEGAVAAARTRRRRFMEWRAYRRQTKHARLAERRAWADQIPPWAFGILHR